MSYFGAFTPRHSFRVVCAPSSVLKLAFVRLFRNARWFKDRNTSFSSHAFSQTLQHLPLYFHISLVTDLLHAKKCSLTPLLLFCDLI